jgi:hypothetical protein
LTKTLCYDNLPLHSDRKVTADFEGGRVSSDGGWLLFGLLDRQHDFSSGVAGCLTDRRDTRYTEHEITTMVRQRLLQIVAGYEDCNDADTLRRDPLLKTVCDRLPESGPDLASQPTLSRLENAVTSRDLYRLSRWLLERYVEKLKQKRRRTIVLDLDATDDPTHGQQEFSFYHGYYRRHIYYPLLVFDGQTADLVAAVLRAGNRGAAFRVVPILRRVVRRIRQALGRRVRIRVRADSGFATPALYGLCDELGLEYEIGLARNPRLQAAVEELAEQVKRHFADSGHKQRLFVDFDYQADSWDRLRRVVAKVEVMELGLNRRFVVTNRRGLSPQQLYEDYTDRGQTENFIKALKNDLAADRLSCHRFRANQFRLLLHAVGYQMVLCFRDYLYGTPWHPLAVETLRRRCGKIGARVRQTTRRIWVHLSSAYPEQPTFGLVLQRLCPG